MTPEQIATQCYAMIIRGTKPTLPEVRPLVDAWYALAGNGAGGGLHVVLDDGNYERRCIQWCIDNCNRYGYKYPDALKMLAKVLLLLSNSQRRKL